MSKRDELAAVLREHRFDGIAWFTACRCCDTCGKSWPMPSLAEACCGEEG